MPFIIDPFYGDIFGTFETERILSIAQVKHSLTAFDRG